jgi:hypothetical protein
MGTLNLFPIYIVSKGRWEYIHTTKALEWMDVNYYIVVEKQEYDNYASVIDENKILILPKKYQDNYDTYDTLGNTKSKGPGAARNFAWDHSIKEGYDWHWVMDDNIRQFYRLNKNRGYRVKSPIFFRWMEDFILRYKNIGMAGPHYQKFVIFKNGYKPFIINTRIYSCNLIRNDVPFRWRGRYNEDTDLSLRMLKNKWCTIQFNAFLQDKITTQHVKGGNTKEFYAKEGTLDKSKMLVKMHPDVSKLVWKFNRWHHHVDYSEFKKFKPIKKEDIDIKKGSNEGKIKLIDLKLIQQLSTDYQKIIKIYILHIFYFSWGLTPLESLKIIIILFIIIKKLFNYIP